MSTVRIQPDARFNVLLTEDRPHEKEHWTWQLPRLLEPQGVATYVVDTGQNALALAERLTIHAAVIDMATPVGEGEGRRSTPPTGADEPAGLWLLELFRRLPNRPPVVIVHNASYSLRQVDRLLRDALRLGAFSVLNKPVELEQLLRVFQRVVEKEYRGFWPKAPPPAPEAGPPTPPSSRRF